MRIILLFTIGYFVSIVIGHYITKLIIDYLWEDSEIKGKRNSKLPAILGLLERLFYTTSFLLNQFTLIAVILGLKALGEWKNPVENQVVQRHQVQIFLIGTLISLLFGLAGGIIIVFLRP